MNMIGRFFRKSTPAIKPGIYHYQAPPDDPRNYRLHLRVEPDMRGLLIVNAATVLHLNETATEYAYHLIQNTPPEKAAVEIAARYQVDRSQALADYQDLAERILTLVETPDLDPVTFLDFERTAPYGGKISAPLRLDCAITYRLPEGADPEAAPTKRVDTELTTNEWKSILSRAWDRGVPHVIFTGGEPTLRDDLPELIAHAEALGQVSGLLTDGLRLADRGYLEKLLQTGLDHILLLAQSDRDAWWQALENVLAADIFTAVHLTITAQNASTVFDVLRKLSSLGLPAISMSSADPSLNQTLADARNLADTLLMTLVWDLPVPYSAQNPVSLEVADQQAPQGAGRAWLYVEPDGDVLPAQGVNKVLGNLTRSDWI
jgi:organic radical activating enzyme